jgi:hypothetical protein
MQSIDLTDVVQFVSANPGWPDLAQEFWQIGSWLQSEICSEGGGFSDKLVFNDRLAFNAKP